MNGWKNDEPGTRHSGCKTMNRSIPGLANSPPCPIAIWFGIWAMSDAGKLPMGLRGHRPRLTTWQWIDLWPRSAR